ncbi:MAG TPA: hypothetical protein VGQ39_11085 [Pyrinomonadaceae bacterium]|nr:hypothetical protein [Pyrinomonadaceae bacterium]
MQEAVQFKLGSWLVNERAQSNAWMFAAVLVLCTLGCALFASWLPLQVSIVTVFLFAGPHNWFELRYFLMRMPVRFGRSRNFFLTAFAGLGTLTITYASLPLLYRAALWSEEGWLTIIAIWNTLLLSWLGLLVWQRSKQKTKSNWFWVLPVALALGAFNWLTPEFFSLILIYVHPLVAMAFLDRHLRRNRPTWLRTYRSCLVLPLFVLALMIWRLSQTTSLADDNGLFWRITQHSGAELLPFVSSHLLVSVHLYLEMLHYGVWLLALPLLGPLVMGNGTRSNPYARVWDLKTVPLARHPLGFPKAVAIALGVGVVLVLMLWLGFSVNYATTRDIYFTIAMAHVMAEAPFLLRMI